MGGNLVIESNNSLDEISDFCGLYTLLSATPPDGLIGSYTVSENGANPTQQQILDLNAACPLLFNAISGRDTTVCAGALVDLSSLLTGPISSNLKFGITFDVYDSPAFVSPTMTTTYFAIDSYSISRYDTAQITVNIQDKPQITGRDTTVCLGSEVDLATIVSGTILNELQYGTFFGTYDLGSSIVSPEETITYFVLDSSETTGCFDTTQITITVLDAMMCLMDFQSQNNISFADPCFCDNWVFVGNQWLVRDTLVITAPAGLTMSFVAAGSSGLLLPDGTPILNGTPIQESSIGSGIYKLEIYKVINVQAVGFVTFGQGAVEIPSETLEVCTQANCPETIPTMGQWALMVLGLFACIFGVIAYRRKEELGFSLT